MGAERRAAAPCRVASRARLTRGATRGATPPMRRVTPLRCVRGPVAEAHPGEAGDGSAACAGEMAAWTATQKAAQTAGANSTTASQADRAMIACQAACRRAA
jgi:hypothetical protein